MIFEGCQICALGSRKQNREIIYDLKLEILFSD